MKINFGGGLTVTATERWLSEIRAGRAFLRGKLLAASVGNYNELQFLNPAASGVTAIVRACFAGTGVGDYVQVRTHNAALATLVGQGVNLAAGGAAGLAAVRSATPAAPDGTLAAEIYTAAGALNSIVPEWLFELDAAEGILITTGNTNVALAATYYWIEI